METVKKKYETLLNVLVVVFYIRNAAPINCVSSDLLDKNRIKYVFSCGGNT